MGVDSGLPDFRGDRGFWQAYPAYEHLKLTFSDLAKPDWFEADPTLAWGFYGHRLGLYRATIPHDGFGVLMTWARRMKHGAYIYTSNVDGQFQRAGFSPKFINEIHGSVHWMQCMANCGIGVFSADLFDVAVDKTTMRARLPLPECPSCGHLARPNVLMFQDMYWDDTRACEQQDGLNKWLEAVEAARLVVVEIGAGRVIPTVRQVCQQAASAFDTPLIRINPDDAISSQEVICLNKGAREGLRLVDGFLG